MIAPCPDDERHDFGHEVDVARQETTSRSSARTAPGSSTVAASGAGWLRSAGTTTSASWSAGNSLPTEPV